MGATKSITMFWFRLILIGLLSTSTWCLGWSKSFDFHDPKGFNVIEFSLAGAYANGILLGKVSETSGYLEFDPAAPEKTTGKITALTKSAQANAPDADAFLRGPSLFDVERFPRITFEIQKIIQGSRIGQSAQLEVMGDLTIKGIKRKVTIPIRMDYLPGKLMERRNLEGDLLIVRGEFLIRRSDFDLGAGKFLKKAANEVKIALTLVGAAPKKAKSKSPLELLPLRSKSSHDKKRPLQRPLRQSPAPPR